MFNDIGGTRQLLSLGGYVGNCRKTSAENPTGSSRKTWRRVFPLWSSHPRSEYQIDVYIDTSQDTKESFDFGPGLAANSETNSMEASLGGWRYGVPMLPIRSEQKSLAAWLWSDVKRPPQ